MNGRREQATAVALALVTVLTRLPFVGRILYHWDSINFAYSLQRFDVTISQPHVPGYPLYVLLARGVNAVLPDPQQALVAISIGGSALAVAWLYLLGARLFGRRIALGAALLLLSSPLYWFYGAIALPHALDAFVVLAAVLLLWRVIEGESKLLLPAAVWLGIAGGLRPQTQLFLMPLAAFAAYHAGWRRAVAATAALGVVDLLWFVPMVNLSGGLAAYLEHTRNFYLAFNSTTSIFSGGGLFGLRRNAIKLSMYGLYGWGAGLPLALLGLGAEVSRHGLRRLRSSLADPRAQLLALWALPALAYYQLIHMGQQGLVFVFLPALCLLSAIAASALAVRTAALALAACANAAVFLLAPEYPLGGDRLRLLTADTLRRHDASLLARIAAVRTHFDARHAAVLSAATRFPGYYLPEYVLLQYRIGQRWEFHEGQSLTEEEQVWRPDDLSSPNAEGFRAVVLFDAELLPFNASPDRVAWVELPDGGRMAYLRLRDGEGIRLGIESFSVTPVSAELP